MKPIKCLLLTLCLLCVTTASALEKRINTPYWVYSPANDFVIKGVTLSDKATTLDICIKEDGGTWSLDSIAHLIANGKNYRITSVKRYIIKDGKTESADFTFNHWLATEEQETDSIIVSFEPLPNNTKTFDFYENDNSNWTVYGIRTVGEPYPSQIKPHKNAATVEMLQPFTPKYEKAFLTGHIYGYTPKTEIISLVSNFFTGKQEPAFCISPSGDFTVETKTALPITSHLLSNNISMYSLLVPGETVHLDIDLAAMTAQNLEKTNKSYQKHDIGQGYAFSGRTSTYCDAINRTDGVIPEKFDTTTTYSEFANSVWNNYQVKMKKVDANKSYTDEERMATKISYQLDYINALSNYDGYVYFAYRDLGNDSIAIEKEKAACGEVSSKDIHAKEMDALSNMYAPYLMNEQSIYLKYMEANGMKQGPVYEWMKDLMNARNKAVDISKNLHVVTDEHVWDSIAPIYRPILREINDSAIVELARVKKLQETNSNKYTICEAPQCSDDMFAAIAAQYKGKVLMIDCWATWCGPCKMGIKAMTPVEEELAKQGAVFVFVTNETSSMADWSAMVPNMSGYHYRLNYAQWQKFKGLNGIPRYKIFDRSGKEILDQTGWNDEFKDKFVKTITDALHSN